MRLSVALVLALTACGSSAAAVLTEDAGGSRDGAGDDDGAALDSTVVVDAGAGANGADASGADSNSADSNGADSTAPFVDAGCVGDGGLPPGLGSPFVCGTETCFSQSQYCTWSVGGIRRGSQPAMDHLKVGLFAAGQCTPLPCSCGAVPTCDCLKSSLMELMCFCIDEGGALGVQCDFL